MKKLSIISPGGDPVRSWIQTQDQVSNPAGNHPPKRPNYLFRQHSKLYQPSNKRVINQYLHLSICVCLSIAIHILTATFSSSFFFSASLSVRSLDPCEGVDDGRLEDCCVALFPPPGVLLLLLLLPPEGSADALECWGGASFCCCLFSKILANVEPGRGLYIKSQREQVFLPRQMCLMKLKLKEVCLKFQN